MSILKFLNAREISHCRRRTAIESLLEDSFVQGKVSRCDFSFATTSSAIIAIALSPDGQTFASTHGDHTVKVFIFNTQTPIRVFRGHPRTPWTIKYHPNDSNIVASGCLGCEVRVWSISKNVCIGRITYNYSIISLAFHPSGNYIAVATATKIILWDWNYAFTDRACTRFTSVKHSRSIKCVAFHPGGNYLFIAGAADSKSPNGICK